MTANSGFYLRDNVLHADGVPLPTLAKQYGTPAYIYSASLIRKNIAQLKKALGPDVLIAFAAKANTNRAVLNLMAQADLGADVVSGGELIRAQRAGIPTNKIVFSGVGKTDKELAAAFEAGIALINIESGAELERIIALKPSQPIRIGFRLNPDVDSGTHAKIATGHEGSKFGMPASEIRQLHKSIADHPTIYAAGISVHIGSQVTDINAFEESFRRLAELGMELNVDTLDFGGGLGIVYINETPPDLDGYAKLVRDILVPLGKKLITEPGRFLVGNAGILLARVIDMKKTQDNPILILDAGMNDLMRPALYDAVHVMKPVIEKDTPETICDVAGPVCESSDMFLRNWKLPEPVRGDLMALMNAGAYGFSMAGTYNSRPLPVEVLVDGDRHATIRQRQSFDDMVKDECLPRWGE
jgi:diaminopimelate decarboxylase